MNLKKRLTIIVPIYNDRESILSLSHEVEVALTDAPFPYRLLFVNDGSTDNPQEIFEEYGLDYISHETNRGYGAAIKTGVQHADSEFICIIDCDGTYAPKDIPGLMHYTDTNDMVVGARDSTHNPWQSKPFW